MQGEERCVAGSVLGKVRVALQLKTRTLAFPHLRTNLSPFTKDFRVEVQYNESIDSFLDCPDGLGCWGDRSDNKEGLVSVAVGG